MTTRAANTGTYSTIGLIAISPPGCTGVGTSFYGSYLLMLLVLALLVACLFMPAGLDCFRCVGEGVFVKLSVCACVLVGVVCKYVCVFWLLLLLLLCLFTRQSVCMCSVRSLVCV